MNGNSEGLIYLCQFICGDLELAISCPYPQAEPTYPLPTSVGPKVALFSLSYAF